MKYGESTFDILYLLFAIITGLYILKHKQNRIDALMGSAALILGLGDAFHLVPRVLNYFVNGDFTVALGVGKFITSITMTIFYLYMYHIYLKSYEVKENRKTTYLLYALACVRVLLCLLPQNHWLQNESDMTFGIIRNIPFTILGFIIVILYYQVRREDSIFKNIWLYVLLSFLFYLPVAIGASVVPMLGMLMLPKTVCYILILITFLKKHKSF